MAALLLVHFTGVALEQMIQPTDSRYQDLCALSQVMSALQHFEAAQAALQTDDFRSALKHFQAASDAEAEVAHIPVPYGKPPPCFLCRDACLARIFSTDVVAVRRM